MKVCGYRYCNKEIKYGRKDRNYCNDSCKSKELAIKKELKSLNNTIGNSKPICSLDVKWNCWNNNLQHCSDVYIKSWHGMKYEDKLIQIKNYLKC